MLWQLEVGTIGRVFLRRKQTCLVRVTWDPEGTENLLTAARDVLAALVTREVLRHPDRSVTVYCKATPIPTGR